MWKQTTLWGYVGAGSGLKAHTAPKCPVVGGQDLHASSGEALGPGSWASPGQQRVQWGMCACQG